MPDVNAQRPYVSPLREVAAQQTRRAVLAAAQSLFVARGYVGTTVEQIAERAAVSKPTVFASVGSKRSLLKDLCDRSVAGGDPVTVERLAYEEALGEPDPRRSLRLYASNIVRMHERHADLDEVLRTAAGSDEELRDLWRTTEDQRRKEASFIVDALMRKGALKPGLEGKTAADVLWVLTSADIFHRLVRGQGWNKECYQRWLGDTFCDQLLPRRSSPTHTPSRR
jgi:AcrR family transcriptional regulator